MNADSRAAAATTVSTPLPQLVKNSQISNSASNGNRGGDDTGDREVPEGADESREVRDVTRDDIGCKARSQGEEENELQQQQKEGKDGVDNEANEEVQVAEATTVADPPDSWEEFDESSVPPAPAATVNSASSASTGAGAGAGANAGADASSLRLEHVKRNSESSSDDINIVGRHKEEDSKERPGLQVRKAFGHQETFMEAVRRKSCRTCRIRQ